METPAFRTVKRIVAAALMIHMAATDFGSFEWLAAFILIYRPLE